MPKPPLAKRAVPAAVERRRERADALPSREELIAFIGGATKRVSKRDIAQAFGVKGDAKAELKLLVKTFEADGVIARRRKALHAPGRLPSIVVADIAERDHDGALIARPAEWSGDGPPPGILVRPPRARRQSAPAPGTGARVLMRVEFDFEAGPEAVAYSGRVIKILDRLKPRAFAVFRKLEDGAGRASPVEKRSAGRDYLVPKGMTGEAQDGDLVAIEALREGRFGAFRARVELLVRSGPSARSASSRSPSIIFRMSFPRPRWPRPGARAPRVWPPRARTGASCRWSPSTRPTPATTTTPSTPSPTTTRTTRAA